LPINHTPEVDYVLCDSKYPLLGEKLMNSNILADLQQALLVSQTRSGDPCRDVQSSTQIKTPEYSLFLSSLPFLALEGRLE